jgi:hypothetical protein
MVYPLLEQQTRLQYRMLSHSGFYTQVHCQDVNTNEKISRELVRGENELVEWAHKFNGKGNLFLGKSPRTAAGEVAGITTVALDCDPVRTPKTASTDDQHDRAINAARQIITRIGDGTLCSSGNGALVLIPLGEIIQSDLDTFERQVKEFEEQIRNTVSDTLISVDSIYDNARLIKLLGSISTKGDKDNWRYARFMHPPRLQRGQILARIRAIAISRRESNGAKDLSLDFSTLQDKTTKALTALEQLSPARRDNYETWLKTGMALRELGEVGLQLWDTWSKESDKYEEGKCQEKWETIENTGECGLGSLVYWAQQDSPVGGARETAIGELWTPASGYDALSAGRTEPGIPSGFGFLDRLCGGYQPGQVYAFEAVTSAGKSVSIIQGAEAVIRAGRRALIVTTEMDKKETCVRYIALATGIPASSVQSRTFTQDERERINSFERDFRTLDRLIIQESASPRIEDLASLVKQARPDVVFFDYFQHVDTGVTTRATELATLIRGIGTLAKDKQIAFVVAAQLHEKFDFKTGRRFPSNKADVKDCRAINDVASVIMVIDWLQKGEDDPTGPVTVKLDLAKNRHGPRGFQIAQLARSIPRFENT